MIRIVNAAASLGLMAALAACSGSDSQPAGGPAPDGSSIAQPADVTDGACEPLPELPEGQIAYTQTREDGTDALFLMKPDGTDRRCLVETAGPDGYPTWSPDGRWLAFIGGAVEGDNDVYVVRADGTRLKQLTETNAVELGPFWSPDGTRIGYTAEAGVDGPTTIHVMSSRDGSADSIVLGARGEGGHAELQDWTNDSQRLLFGGVHAGRAGTWTMRADGTHFRFLGTGPGDYGSGAVYSPDGKSLVFQADLDGGCIYTSDAVMRHVVRLTEGCSEGFNLTWSPDGRWIAWAGGPHGPADAYVMTADGSHVRKIADGSDVAYMTWQPATRG